MRINSRNVDSIVRAGLANGYDPYNSADRFRIVVVAHAKPLKYPKKLRRSTGQFRDILARLGRDL